MSETEVLSWLFVYKEWDKLRRMPIPDKGFEDCFREYLYRKVTFDVVSRERDMGLGLSYHSLSDTPHELDAVCVKAGDLYIFELKHYEASTITKEIVFTFWGKVLDFYLGNPEVLSNYKITMFLVTVNRSIDDSVRQLCLTYGVKLIEPSLMTVGVMDYFARDLYLKTSEEDAKLKSEVEELVEKVGHLKEASDHRFSDIMRHRDEGVTIDLPLLRGRSPVQTLFEIRDCYSSFEKARLRWKAQRS